MEAARLIAVVVLPTPPFWFATAMTRPKFSPPNCGIYHSNHNLCKLFHVKQTFLCGRMRSFSAVFCISWDSCIFQSITGLFHVEHLSGGYRMKVRPYSRARSKLSIWSLNAFKQDSDQILSRPLWHCSTWNNISRIIAA